MEYENDKQVIFIKDLLFAILYRWRIILVAMLIGGILLGAYQFSRIHNGDFISAQEESQKKIERLEKQIKIKTDAIENQEMYLQQSFLMSIDPYNVYKVSVDFYIRTNYQIMPDMQYQNPDSTGAILNAYKTLLDDHVLLEKIAETVNVDVKYAAEVISYQTTSTSNPGVLSITVTHPDLATANKVVDLIKDYTTSFTEQFSQQLDEHTLTTINVTSGVVTDTELANSQRQATDQLSNMYASRTQQQQELSQLSLSKLTISPAFMTVIGAVIGAFLVVAYALLMHICSAKAYSVRTLTNQSNVTVIGNLPANSKKNFIDALLQKLEGRNTDTWDNQIALLGAYLKNIGCAEKLMLTGEANTELIEKAAQSLAEVGIQAVPAGCLLHDASALNTLPDSAAILLLEQRGMSNYRDVEKEVALIQRFNKPLLGCVFIDN